MENLGDWEITEAMIRFGGGFVQQLGRLFRAADPENAARLKAAFPTYWTKYRAIAITQEAKLRADQNAGQ